MALIELYCPRCGGDVRMDRSMVFGTCESCGARCMLQEIVPRRTEVSVQGAPTVDGLVDLALRSWLIGDEESSYRAVVDALSRDPEDVRAWILRGLMDDMDVTSAMVSGKLDPVRDLEFCLSVLDRRPDAMRWISGRMDHPLIRSAAALQGMSTYLQRSGHIILTMFDDELETGYERVSREFIGFLDDTEGHIAIIRAEPRLSRFASSFDDATLGRLRSHADWLGTHAPVDSQRMTVRYDGIALFASFEHIHSGMTEAVRPKGGRIVTDVRSGRHVFRCGPKGGLVALVPRMPAGMTCEGTLTPGGEYVEVVHTFELTDGLFLNVNTRDMSLPATFDMDDNLVPTSGNVHQLGRFL